MVGRRENGTEIFENVLLVGCVTCGGSFRLQVPWRVPNVPEHCAGCTPSVSPMRADEASQFTGDAPVRRVKPSPIRDAARDAVDHFSVIAETALLRDMLAYASERIHYSGKGRDNRAYNVKKELRKVKDIRIDGDIVIFD